MFIMNEFFRLPNFITWCKYLYDTHTHLRKESEEETQMLQDLNKLYIGADGHHKFHTTKFAPLRLEKNRNKNCIN